MGMIPSLRIVSFNPTRARKAGRKTNHPREIAVVKCAACNLIIGSFAETLLVFGASML